MTATIHSLRAGPPDPIAELFTERERLGAELARFVVVDERQAAAEAKIREIDAALAAIDRADREAVERWAETVEGEPPAPLLDERKALLARRLDAEAGRQAAEIAVAAVAVKRTGLIVAMNAVGGRIKERQIGAALDQARGLHAEVVKLSAEVGDRMMRLEGLRQMLAESLSETAARRDDAQAEIFRAALSEVEKLRAPQLLGDLPTVAQFATEWRGILQ